MSKENKENSKDPIEQLTFTEKESEAFTKFLNYVAKSAKFEFNTKEAFEYSNVYVACLGLEKKINDHVFEIKKVVHNSSGDKK